jgi:hypothetical protein
MGAFTSFVGGRFDPLGFLLGRSLDLRVLLLHVMTCSRPGLFDQLVGAPLGLFSQPGAEFNFGLALNDHLFELVHAVGEPLLVTRQHLLLAYRQVTKGAFFAE